ncbi:MAG: hypothetical protein KAS72_05270 [Phycisphaerales bacterium]|nr:hypothetical protein [Phycisphaerales bacterium]
MKQTHAIALAALALCLIGQPAASQAQELVATPESTTYIERQLINVTFPGGNVAEYIAAIERATENINFVVAPEAEFIPMPAVELEAVSPWSAVRLIDRRVGYVEGDPVQVHVRRSENTQPSESPIYIIHAETHRVRRAADPVPEPQDTIILPVAMLLDADVPAEDILACVDIALGLSDDDLSATVRFHEETGLLIARGDHRQLSTIHELIGALGHSVEQRLSNPIEMLEGELMEAREVIEALEAETEEAWGAAEEAHDRIREMEGHFEAMEHEFAMMQERMEQEAREAVERMREEFEHVLREREMRIHELERELEAARNE